MTDKIYIVFALLILSFRAYVREYQVAAFPDNSNCKVRPYYIYHSIDGKPELSVIIKFKCSKLYDAAEPGIVVGKTGETIQILANSIGTDCVIILLPRNISVRQESKVSMTLQRDKNKLIQTIQVLERNQNRMKI